MTNLNGWDPQRFWSRVDKSGECWEWTGTRGWRGYGRININRITGTRSPQLAHRVSWMLATGVLPSPEDCVLHRCDNPPCVRPEHLFLGTKKDNVDDMIAKGRQRFHDVKWSDRTHGTRNGMARLTEAKVIELRERAAAGEYFRDLAPEFGIAASTANAIILGRTWRHVWPYSEDSPPTREIVKRGPRRKAS